MRYCVSDFYGTVEGLFEKNWDARAFAHERHLFVDDTDSMVCHNCGATPRIRIGGKLPARHHVCPDCDPEAGRVENGETWEAAIR